MVQFGFGVVNAKSSSSQRRLVLERLLPCIELRLLCLGRSLPRSTSLRSRFSRPLSLRPRLFSLRSLERERDRFGFSLLRSRVSRSLYLSLRDAYLSRPRSRVSLRSLGGPLPGVCPVTPPNAPPGNVGVFV